MSKNISVGLFQPYVSQNQTENFAQVDSLFTRLITECFNKGEPLPDLICLPERWLFVDPFQKPFEKCLQEERGQQYQFIQALAKKYKIPIVSGGIWEKRIEKDNLNGSISVSYHITCYVFDRTGRELGRQDKIQLYGLEQTKFIPGKSLNLFTIGNLKFSVLICFDLNISSVLTQKAVKNGAELILSPTLIRKDGFENWNVYVHARALENRVPLVSCNSVFQWLDRDFAGESKIIQFKPGISSPVKMITDQMDQAPGYLVKNINLSFPNRIRKERLEEKILGKDIQIQHYQ